jgi:hypothetical protein
VIKIQNWLDGLQGALFFGSRAQNGQKAVQAGEFRFEREVMVSIPLPLPVKMTISMNR